MVVNLVKNYESPSRFWLGNRLFFAVYDPKNLEVVLNSSKALGKAYLYDFLKTVVGDGLFTAKRKLRSNLVKESFRSLQLRFGREIGK